MNDYTSKELEKQIIEQIGLSKEIIDKIIIDYVTRKVEWVLNEYYIKDIAEKVVREEVRGYLREIDLKELTFQFETDALNDKICKNITEHVAEAIADGFRERY